MTDASASRDARLISLGTLVSRVTGLARVVVAAAVMGTGTLGGLYETTNRIPNFLFDLFAGGALQAVLIPAFVRAREEGGGAGLRRLADSVSGAIMAFLGVVTAAGMAAARDFVLAQGARRVIAAVAGARSRRVTSAGSICATLFRAVDTGDRRAGALSGPRRASDVQ